MSNISTSEITFIITTFKSEKFIYGCLDSLPVDSKKIVVENGSNFKLKNSLETKYQNLECYIMKTNLGYGSANNFAINNNDEPLNTPHSITDPFTSKIFFINSIFAI